MPWVRMSELMERAEEAGDLLRRQAGAGTYALGAAVLKQWANAQKIGAL